MALTTPTPAESVPSLRGYRAAVVHDFHASEVAAVRGGRKMGPPTPEQAEALAASAREDGIELVGPPLN